MKRIIAIILEIIPIIAAPTAYLLTVLPFDSDGVKRVIAVSFMVAFFGFVFFFIGRKLAKGDRTVLILGILDWLATLFVIGFYILTFIAFGL